MEDVENEWHCFQTNEVGAKLKPQGTYKDHDEGESMHITEIERSTR